MEEQKNWSGAEPFLVGIAPSFWSHVPLSIGQVHDLKLIEGISCRIEKKSDKVKPIPVSRCRLVGTVVAAERRTNGSVLYVIDDGTGIIDCLFWVEKDLYSLPSLTNKPDIDDGILSVGQVVRVLGRIECVSVQGAQGKITLAGREWEFRDCIREIHASLIEPMQASRAAPNSMDAETKHWLDSLQQCSNTNALDVLELLGPKIAAQVADQSNLPAVDDTTGAWRLFGLQCRCMMAYKDSLLYCHCQATVEPLDPHFRYRDALLNMLLDMEQSQTSSTEPLRFQYKTASENKPLLEISREEISRQERPSTNVARLVANTFRLLRQDGVLHLLDAESDTYLLISREKVLEPSLRTLLSSDAETAVERANLKKNPPNYLAKVPKVRLQFVRRNVYNDRAIEA